MMIPKKNLRKRVVLGEKTNQDLDPKKSVTSEQDQRKKYKRRKTDKLDSGSENCRHQTDGKEPCVLKNSADVSNLQSKNNDLSKENRIKLKGKRQIIKLDHSPKIENRVSNCETVDKRNVKNEENLKSSVIPNKVETVPIWRRKLPNPPKICTLKKTFDIYDISQDEDMSRIVKGISKKMKKISQKSGKSVKKFLKKNIVSKKGLKPTQKKTDPSPDQCKASKSHEPKSNPRSCSVPIQSKVCEVPQQTGEKATEKPCLGVENNNQLNPPEPLNFEEAPPYLTCYDASTILLNVADLDESKSNPSRSVAIQAEGRKVSQQNGEKSTEKPCLGVKNNNQPNPPEPFDDETEIISEPLNFEEANPYLTCYDASTILLNVADDFEKSVLHPRMTSTPDTAAMGTVHPKNNDLILNNISHIASSNRNIVQGVIDTPDLLTAKESAKRSADDSLFKLPEPKRNKPAVLKFPQKPLPKMTSTPNTAVMAVNPSKNNILNNISHIPSNDRNIVKVIIDTPDPLPFKKLTKKRSADVTLFESPEPKKKNPNKPRSPQKSVQMNLMDDFLFCASPERSLDESVKKPSKAYHTPDNFKTHLARTKRISEMMRVEKKKSREELLIEQMAKHFEEVSGMELCIE